MSRETYYVEVVAVERVGKDWLECGRCGCKYPPGSSCPFQRYHDDPTAIDAEAVSPTSRAEASRVV